MAIGFETENARRNSADCYFTALADELLPKRDLLAQMLQNAGMVPTIPEGGYFMIADFSKLGEPLFGFFCPSGGHGDSSHIGDLKIFFRPLSPQKKMI